MGVLNVTPHSFSDGGRFSIRRPPSPRRSALPPKAPTSSTSARNPQDLMATRSLCRSTRSVHVLRRSCRPWSALGIPVSIDTMKAAVAAWAIDGRRRDRQRRVGTATRPDMARVVAGHDVPVIVMQIATPPIRGSTSSPMSPRLRALARYRGPRRHSLERIVLDPGIGFGKTPEQSRPASRGRRWREFGLPLLVGASRKRFIHSIVPSEPAERLGGSLARTSGRRERRRHRPRPRRGADRAGAGRRRGHQAGAMSDARLRQRAGAARLSRRDAARGQGRADLQARPDARHRPGRSLAQRHAQARRLLRQGGATATEAFCSRRYRLVEAAAGAVAEAVLEHHPGRRIRVTVHKPHAPIAATFDDVGVVIERARQEARQGRTLAEAFIALGGNVGDVRATFDRAIALCATAAVCGSWRDRSII